MPTTIIETSSIDFIKDNISLDKFHSCRETLKTFERNTKLSSNNSKPVLNRSFSCPELDFLLPNEPECKPIRLKLAIKNPGNIWDWKCLNKKANVVKTGRPPGPAKRKPSTLTPEKKYVKKQINM